MLSFGTTIRVMLSRSRKGAWIEISGHRMDGQRNKVAPARERGLKS